MTTKAEQFKTDKTSDNILFRDKTAEIVNNGVKLFFKEAEDEQYYLVHVQQGKKYISYWESTNGSSRDITSGKSLAAINTQVENKLKAEAADFASKEEVKKFLREAGIFIKNHFLKIFPFEDSFERSDKETMLINVYKHVKSKYHVVLDKETYNLCIYDSGSGVYKEHDEKQFASALKRHIKRDFFEDEIKKIIGLFKDIKSESEDYIAFKNCLLNINTLETREFTPDIFVKFQVPYNWNPQAQSPFFQTKLSEILNDEEKHTTFLELVGYCFTKYNPHNKIFILIGNGANGKSLLMEIIGSIFQNSLAAVNLQDFNKEFGLSPLIGKRVNLLPDIPIEKIVETGQIKAITGEDPLTINRKFKEPITTKLGCKIIGSGNRLPEIKDNSYAFWRRIIIIRLDKRFVDENKDPHLKEKLVNDTEGMEWLIYHSIQAYKQIKETGWPEDSLDEIRLEYLKVSKPAEYAATHIFTVTNDPENFISRQEIILEIDNFIENEVDIRRPAYNSEYYDAVRNLGAEEGQKGSGSNKVHGFRYLKKPD